MTGKTLTAVRLGDRVVDLTLAGGRIARIAPSAAPARGLILPPLVDAHVHLDKTHVADRLPHRPRTLAEAIEAGAADRERWTAADIHARATRALAEAEAHGIVALRTHVNWPGRERPLAWDVLGELALEWRGRVQLERASFSSLDLVGDPDPGAAVAAEVAATGGVLGAFVYRQEHLPAKLETVFALALRYDLALDFHVDEGLDREARGFDTIVALTRRHHLPGQVLCGHACALAVRPEADVARLLDAAGEAGLGLCVLPTTNGWLQDAAPGRTPRLRGLAPMQEARAAGVDVLVALDNVRDAFYPYGEYDLLDAWRLAVLNAHLDPADWLDSITTLPAKWLGVPRPLAAGGPADFVHVAVPDPAALVTNPRAARRVWRAGRPLT